MGFDAFAQAHTCNHYCDYYGLQNLRRLQGVQAIADHTAQPLSSDNQPARSHSTPEKQNPSRSIPLAASHAGVNPESGSQLSVNAAPAPASTPNLDMQAAAPIQAEPSIGPTTKGAGERSDVGVGIGTNAQGLPKSSVQAVRKSTRPSVVLRRK